jgi:hypothetical protein
MPPNEQLRRFPNNSLAADCGVHDSSQFIDPTHLTRWCPRCRLPMRRSPATGRWQCPLCPIRFASARGYASGQGWPVWALNLVIVLGILAGFSVVSFIAVVWALRERKVRVNWIDPLNRLYRQGVDEWWSVDLPGGGFLVPEMFPEGGPYG